MSGSLLASGAGIPDMQFGPIAGSDCRHYADASLDDNPLHLDPGAALAAGLDRPIVHGMLMMGLFEQVLANWQPTFRAARLHATFLRPVMIDSVITIGGKVAQAVVGREGTLLHLRLLVRTEGGELACVGEASGRISSL
jgi:acyl dehydratase